MPRKRDGLVPVAEALADLPGPGSGDPSIATGAAGFHPASIRWTSSL